MKMAVLLLLVICVTIPLRGVEEEAQDVRSTAEQLDNLISQQKVLYKKVGQPGFKPKRVAVPPVDIKRVVPMVAPRLKMSEEAVAEVLRKEPAKLSDLVIARWIEVASDKTWKELLSSYNRQELIALAEEHQVIKKVARTINAVYADVSLAAFDTADENTASGRAPAGASGAGKDRKR
jgi:hypothetical protein